MNLHVGFHALVLGFQSELSALIKGFLQRHSGIGPWGFEKLFGLLLYKRSGC